ncbi:MAG TPA: ABC transporter ATP-binding protein [Lachnospiraceae bacterium]|nr:ABC transporter ATP-binding protein [Lachnospiraceae bacterium]
MGKILKYLKESWLAVLVIIVLLVAQAYCDLQLPQYTSDIVDIGIGKGGIAYAAPEKMQEETYKDLQMFMTEEEKETCREMYEQDADGNYVLIRKDATSLGLIEKNMGLPMVLYASIQSGQTEYDLKTLREMYSQGMITQEQIGMVREKALEGMGDMSDSIISTRAVQLVQEEYEALGMDTGKIQTDYLIKTGLKMLLLSILMMAAAILTGLIASITAAKVGRSLRNGVFNKVVAFSSVEMDQFSTASLITRSTNDIQQVQMVEGLLLKMVLYAPIIGVGGIVKVAGTNTGMGWIIGVAVGTIMSLVLVLLFVALPKFKKMPILLDRVNLVSREILTGIPVIRAFTREKYEEKRFDKANMDLMSNQLFTGRVMSFMMPVMMLIMNAITIAIVWFGGKGIEAGNMQVGQMLAFITYTMQIVMSFLMITMISIMVPRAAVSANRIDEVLKTEVTIRDSKEVKDESLKDTKGVVHFEDVSFKYPGADEVALSHLSFTAVPGKTTAIIGSTGSGKSTLLHLIPRFYDVTEGRITLDGVDIREISQKKLRSALGFVPQKGVLFSGDIASNIKFADENISVEKMKEAAGIAQATEFIEAKEEGYGSSIAQGGTNVSGGQKQRLAIARAIAKNPKVFLFDDSFSALDYKTDIALRKALHEKVATATVIIVAQRINTILYADQILVLENGTIVGKGTHQELLKTCETYQEIAKSQLSENELKGGTLE